MAQPESDETPTAPNALTPAVEWVRERGGCVPCARSVLVLTAGKAEPRDIRAALQKAKAPPEVFGLIWRDVWEQTRCSK